MEQGDSMPEESSWTRLLADLVRGFILLRDLFGYVLPGAFFLLIGAQSGHLSSFADLSKIPGAESHPWMAVFLLLLLSYVLGHFLVVTFYFIPDVIDLIKMVVRKWRRKEADANKAKHKSDYLRYHEEYPDIFIEYDRQSIIALLRQGLAASLLLGLLVFYRLYSHPLRVMAAAGVIMLINTYFGGRHIKELKKLTLKAAEDAAKAKPCESK